MARLTGFLRGLLLTLLTIQRASCLVQLNADVSHDTTLRASLGPYVISSGIIVYPEVTLTIEPGTALTYTSGGSIQLKGKLVARGTASSRITFQGPGGPGGSGAGGIGISVLQQGVTGEVVSIAWAMFWAWAVVSRLTAAAARACW